MVYKRITRLLAERTECNPADIKKEVTFEELGLDSFDGMKILLDLEDEFNIEIKKESFTTIGELSDLIEKEIPTE